VPPLPVPTVGSDARTDSHLDKPWTVIVWDDPINLQTYVTYVFQTYFGFTFRKAQRLMLTVHNHGRAVVASGAREQMEMHVEAMHSYGLWATLEKPEG
jgi:ATP-dependent Clp protease adaptor protein ClpS